MPAPQLLRCQRRNHGSLQVADSDHRDVDDDHHDHGGGDNIMVHGNDDSCNTDDDTYDVQMIMMIMIKLKSIDQSTSSSLSCPS